jgi:hypothetical protein
MHSNQHNFTYKDSYHMVSRSVSMASNFIIIILWLFHSPLTCRLVYNTNTYISMHYHHVNSFNHNIPIIQITLNIHRIYILIIDCIISIIIQIMLNIHRIGIHIIDCIIFNIIQITLNIHRIVIHIGSYVLKLQVYHR